LKELVVPFPLVIAAPDSQQRTKQTKAGNVARRMALNELPAEVRLATDGTRKVTHPIEANHPLT
jgi:hypothetical protein